MVEVGGVMDSIYMGDGESYKNIRHSPGVTVPSDLNVLRPISFVLGSDCEKKVKWLAINGAWCLYRHFHNNLNVSFLGNK